ncbi:hypothetical protein [Marinicauda sp. Alg238-R41]|uniref:hypothetical protein n=1 Tax=Marinicauda sp. Alg238-R41 TaxID=2993447 RepID=UPI0022E744FD|nr:hypothetical protein [Marinicauda sp. Alg238-R41]
MVKTSKFSNDPASVPAVIEARSGIVSGLSRSGNAGADAREAIAPCSAARLVLALTAPRFGLSLSDFIGRPRGRSPVGRARQAAVALFIARRKCSVSVAARAFGIDESTAREAVSRVDARRRECDAYDAACRAIAADLQALRLADAGCDAGGREAG